MDGVSDRPYLVFVPSLLLGAVGAVWVAIAPPNLGPRASAGTVALTAGGLIVVLAGAAWLLEKWVPSFRRTGRMIERVLRRLGLPWYASVGLAALTAVSEEVFFRGALLSTFGLWPQAVLFGVLHPAPGQGWAYPLFAFGAGAAFGWATLFTGTLWPALIAHFAINLHGMLEARGRRGRSTARREPES